MTSIVQAPTRGIQFKDKIGYALGDTAGLFTFAIIGAFLQMFYTDVLYIDLNKIIVLMLIARIWDAINDPIWGAFIDSRKPTKYGKFRPYILWLSFPLAVGGILLFTKIPGLSETQYLLYAYITYIFYGMMYTGTNIPYGSLASVITDDEIERSDLSVFRSLGAGLGGLPAQIILPLIVFSTSETGEKFLDERKLTPAVIVLAAASVIVYYLSFRFTKERVTSPAKPPKYNIDITLKVLVRNRAFIVLCAASMMLIASQIYSQTLINYLFKDYFGNPKLFSLYTFATYGPMLLLVPFMGKLVKRFGKKEICAWGMALSAFINIVLWLMKTENPYIFLLMCLISGIGATFFVLEVWALVTDVIDYQEHLSGRREEGTSYAFFSFTRKLGQTIAGVLGVYALNIIAYDAKNITTEVVSKMYSVSTFVPAMMFGSIFILLNFLYPLGKSRLRHLHENEYAVANPSESDV